MSRHPDIAWRARVWALAWVTAALAVGAGSLIPWVMLELQKQDTEALESPLVVAAAGQLVDGPEALYGPYGGRNHRVLIHAPLYYRLTALFAWPLVRAGLAPVPAALLVGRMLSTLGFAAALVAVYHLARLSGAPWPAGWWAVLLAAATPVYGGLPFEVRPDMLGAGLQSTGVLLVLKALHSERPRPMLVWAFACLGLAVCIKQHFIVTPAFSAVLLLYARLRGRLSVGAIVLPLLVVTAIVVVYYAVEECATSGRMSRSVFIAAASASRIHPADWYFAGNILLALVWKCVGLILLLAAAGSATVMARPGRGRRLLATTGAGLIGLIAALTVIQLFVVDMRVSILIVAGSLVTMICFVPAYTLVHVRGTRDPIDAALWVYCALELALTAVLCRLSTGAWYNYAIQGVLFACVLAARALARAFEGAAPAPSVARGRAGGDCGSRLRLHGRQRDPRQAQGRPRRPGTVIGECKSAVQRDLLRGPPGRQPGVRPAGPGLRSLALPRLRVDRPGGASLRVAHTRPLGWPDSHRRRAIT